MIVLDASAALEVVRESTAGEVVTQRMRDADSSVHIPHLLLVEVTSSLRRLCAAGVISDEGALQAIGTLIALPAARYEHDLLLPRVWQLRDNLSAYDAVYVALAEMLGATLLTTDQRIANAPGHKARVEVLAA